MIPLRLLPLVLLSLAPLVPLQVRAEEPAHLQIFNGSSQTIDLFEMKSATQRIPSGSVAPGTETNLNTTLGQRFVLIGREDPQEISVISKVKIQGFRYDPSSKDGIPAFYTQIEKLRGFPIVASAKVSPYALKEAAFICNLMLVKRPDVLQAMVESGARLCILGYQEFTCDLPEFHHLGREPVPKFEKFSGKDFWDARARGTGGSETDPFASCAEENLLSFPGDPYSTENILIHEFAHSIHLRGLNNVDPTFDARLHQTYLAAMKAGLWKTKYASVNDREYFAEGVQSWFDNNRENDHDHNHVNTRAELIEYDPALAALCREVFADTEIKYTKATTRLHHHLEGYDPATAPSFVWPERLQAVKEAIHHQAVNRN